MFCWVLQFCGNVAVCFTVTAVCVNVPRPCHVFLVSGPAAGNNPVKVFVWNGAMAKRDLIVCVDQWLDLLAALIYGKHRETFWRFHHAVKRILGRHNAASVAGTRQSSLLLRPHIKASFIRRISPAHTDLFTHFLHRSPRLWKEGLDFVKLLKRLMLQHFHVLTA